MNYKYYVYVRLGYIKYFDDYNEAKLFAEDCGLDEDAVIDIEHISYDLY